MTDSIMSSCAGSVAVSARPAFPCTDAISGNRMMMRSCADNARRASSIAIPGNVVGMTRSDPSSRGGMNSLPIRVNGTHVTISAATAAATTGHRQRSTRSMTGRYTATSAR
ncbi:hypothetical protein D3C83_30990 [compost metagenome]